MKKLATIILSICLALALVGCGSSSGEQSASGEKDFVDSSQLSSVYASPDSYKGKYIELTGKVFGDMSREQDTAVFQMWQDTKNTTNNTIVSYSNKDFSVSDGDYVKVTGKIVGSFQGENSFGGTVTALSILATNVEISSYAEVIAPAIKTITPENSQQEQHGCIVKIDKIEFAENETRIYLTATNNSGDTMSLYSFNAKIIQGTKQYEEETNYDADYPEVQSDILKGVSSSGVICFPAVDSSIDFKIYIEARNENYSLNFNPYEFMIAAK